MGLIFEYDFVLPETSAIEVVELPESGSVLDIQGNPDLPVCRGAVIAAQDQDNKRTLSIEVPSGQEGYSFLRLWLEARQPVAIRQIEETAEAVEA